MMKICIVTNYRRTTNYGAVLQAFALNEFININGYDCKTLNYTPSPDTKDFLKKNIKKPFRIAAVVINRIYKQPIKKVIIKRRKIIDLFRDSNIPHTEPFVAEYSKLLSSEFDVFICGSDQIWREGKYSDRYDDVMWLRPFNQVKKLSYAASMGVETVASEDKKKYIKETLEDYSHISVREESAATLIHNITGRNDIEVVADPVFLLTKDMWEEVSSSEKDKDNIINTDYIFSYFIQPNSKVYKNIKLFAKEKGLNIYSIPFTSQTFSFKDYFFTKHKLFAPTVEVFVSLIQNAKYVVTDSFHATMFAMIFGVDFTTFITNHGTRLRNALHLFGMEKRISSGKVIPDELTNSDRTAINEVIKKERERCAKYLLECIEH